MGVTMNKTSNSVKFKGIILTLTGGCFWGLLAALFLAVYTIQPAELLSYYDTTMVIGWGMLIGGLLLIVAFRP